MAAWGVVRARGQRWSRVAGRLTVGAGVLAACTSGPSGSVTTATSVAAVAESTTTASTSTTTTILSTTTTSTLPHPTTTGPEPAIGSAGGPEWSLLAAGDVLMDDTEPAGVDPFAAVQPALASGALAVVNAEMAIADIGAPEAKTYTFRAPPAAADRMAAAGVDVANLANNHSLDFGVDAMLATIGHLRAAGVATVGAGHNAGEAFAPVVATVGGVRVAVLGASRVYPRREWAAGEGPGLASAYNERQLLASIRAAKTNADVVVVAVHWGVEGSPCPDKDQERLGAAMLDAGASVVLGSHPHVLQPILADSRGVLAYSLGNFVFHRRRGTSGESGVLEVRFAGAQVVGHQFHPHVLDQGPPRPAGPEAAARIAAATTNPCLPPPPTTTTAVVPAPVP